ncbi:TetR/AcrR family transcriptional regulator [Phenylobacterium sp.]|uniref:TetR/AcrR family transcriptional regulator n=1 Tax=Phenylobacterium sp. TaxID=1871053 RepID=UPI003569BA9F
MPLDTRLRILLAAMDLFQSKGYGSTSVSDILSRSQANSGSLYHFFPGKQDVLVGVLELYRDGIRQMLLEPAWQGVEDPIDRIFALLARYRLALLESECIYGCPIGSLALELHEPDPPVRELLAQNFTGWTRAIGGCLEDAAERLPRGTDIQGLAEFILTTMEGGVMQARTHRDIAYFDRSIEQLRHHMELLAMCAAAARIRLH